jgi:hypothetical protein
MTVFGRLSKENQQRQAARIAKSHSKFQAGLQIAFSFFWDKKSSFEISNFPKKLVGTFEARSQPEGAGSLRICHVTWP